VDRSHPAPAPLSAPAPADFTGSAAWRAPSNIAIVKYWGKHGVQLPRNPSVSLTLSEAVTETTLYWRPGSGRLVAFAAGGEADAAFADRVAAYLGRMAAEHPALARLDWGVATANAFPHSSGIASSASGFAALALGLASAVSAQALPGEDALPADGPRFRAFAGRLARLGSGSACRSLCGPWMAWGATDAFSGNTEPATDEHAVPLDAVHPDFRTWRDAIGIVDAGRKAVSSTAGHRLMEGNPFAGARFANARRRTGELAAALRGGDADAFVAIAEAEALELHALMMTSSPSYVLMRPATLELIQRVRAWRADTGLPVAFTLDAGPNLHLLYPASAEEAARDWIASEMAPLCADGRVLYDGAGPGPDRI
jgi:diphosphomevalonate decarboxylase